jgi:hypothetical protein
MYDYISTFPQLLDKMYEVLIHNTEIVSISGYFEDNECEYHIEVYKPNIAKFKNKNLIVTHINKSR